MRIGIDYRLANCSHRGMARYCREIVKKLLVLDNDNKYLLFIDSISNDSFVDYDNVEYVKINTSNFIVGEQIIIPFLLYRKKCDVFWSPYNTFPVILPSSTRLVVTVHDVIFFYSLSYKMNYKQRIGALYRRYILKLFYSHVDKYLTVSQYSKKEILNYLDIRVPIEITYNCIGNISKYVNNKGRSDNLDENYFFTLSGDSPSKNLDVLLRVFERYYPDLRLVVGGVSKLSPFRKRQSKQICFLDEGISDDLLVQYYLNCRCFLFCSKYEGFGIPVIEAAICGKPIIASNTTSIPEILDGKGWLIDPTEEGIKNSIADFLKGDKEMDCNYSASINKFTDWIVPAKKVLESLIK